MERMRRRQSRRGKRGRRRIRRWKRSREREAGKMKRWTISGAKEERRKSGRRGGG